MKTFSTISFACLWLPGLQHAVVVEGQSSPPQCMSFQTVPEAKDIFNILKDPYANMEFRNLQASDHACWKSFTDGHVMGTNKKTDNYLLPDEGIIMSTGTPEDFCGSESGKHTYQWGTGGDEDLTAMVETNIALQRAKLEAQGIVQMDDLGGPQTTYDACEIEFEFKCTDGSPDISLEYVFGSEEYFEVAGGSDYHDVFALFLNGKNLAMLPDGETMVTMSNVNSAYNSEFFIENDKQHNGDEDGDGDGDGVAPYPSIEADGFTTPLTSQGTLDEDKTQWNKLKMVIADKADNILDSYLLLRKSSFTCVVGSRGGDGGSVRGAGISGASEGKPYDKPAPTEPLPSRGGDARPDVPILPVAGQVEPRSPRDKRPNVAVLPVQQVQPVEDVAVQLVQPAEAGDRRDEKWYPNLMDEVHPYMCVFGADYVDWMALPQLNEPYLFDSENDCCQIHYCNGDENNSERN